METKMELNEVKESVSRHEMKALQETISALQEKFEAQQAALQSLRDENASLRDKQLHKDALYEARDVLSKIKDLPLRTQQRLAEKLAQDPPVKEGRLDRETFKPIIEGAARDFMAELAEATGGSRPYGLGSSNDAQADPARLEESIQRELISLGISEKAAKLSSR